MARTFDRNMFIMLLAIMIGAVIITFFIADIVNQSEIDTLNIEHKTQITDLASRNENFTDNFLQGSIKMDDARETREYANYFFDLALIWYNTAVAETQNDTQLETYKTWIAGNCSEAMDQYQLSNTRFKASKPFFENAKQYTSKPKYLEVLGYYTAFADAGQNITALRYQSSKYLKQLSENLTTTGIYDQNISELLDLFNQSEAAYDDALPDYEGYQGQIDEYLFFDEIREQH